MKTKIVATLGPASDNEEVLTKMIEAGVDVCRLNFSHGSHDYHAGVMETIRRCSLNTAQPVAIPNIYIIFILIIFIFNSLSKRQNY